MCLHRLSRHLNNVSAIYTPYSILDQYGDSFLSSPEKLGKIFTMNLCFCAEYYKHHNRVSAMYTRYSIR